MHGLHVGMAQHVSSSITLVSAALGCFVETRVVSSARLLPAVAATNASFFLACRAAVVLT